MLDERLVMSYHPLSTIDNEIFEATSHSDHSEMPSCTLMSKTERNDGCAIGNRVLKDEPMAENFQNAFQFNGS